MKNLKKLTAAILAAAMLAVFAGCGDQSWSYKTDSVSLTAGTYIYNLLNGYYEAYDLVESPDEAKDILKEEVTDSDSGETKTVEQYAYDTADETTLKMIAVEELFKSYGLELNKTEYDAALSYTDQVWSTVKTQFEDYGISQDSFKYCYAEYTVKNGQVFEHLYGKDGDEYVTDDEMTKFFKENYDGYAYFTVYMADVDDEGNSVAKSDEEFEKAQKLMDEYVEMINKSGKTYEDVVKKHVSEYDLTSDPTSSGSVKKDDNTLPTDIADVYSGLKEGEAAMVKTGEEAQTIYYFVYKTKSDEVIDFLDTDSDSDSDASGENETSENASVEVVETADSASGNVFIYPLKSGYSHYSLLNEMKGDDFNDYLVEYANSLNVSKNSAVVNSFKPKMFVD